MRLATVSEELEGQILGRSVTDAFGRVLLRAGTRLTARYSQHLAHRGFVRVWVCDRASEAADPPEALSLATQWEAAAALRSAVARLGAGPSGYAAGGAAVRLTALEHAVERILAELRKSPVLAVELASLRAVRADLLAHSVRVCAYALTLGHDLGLERDELVTLGLGALLQDVGHVQLARVWSRSSLNSRDRRALRAHAYEGFRIVRDELRYDLRAAHMAYQHHERLDGSGYPRGLRGQQVILFARIGAIADLYDGATARGTRPERALAALQRQAGLKLDGELVRRFARRVAMVPTGTCWGLESGEVDVLAAPSAHGSAAPREPVPTGPEPVPTGPEPVPVPTGPQRERILSVESEGRRVRRLLPHLPPSVHRRASLAGL